MVKCITLEYPDGSIATRGGLGPRMLARFNGDRDAALNYILSELVPAHNPDAVARIEDVTFPTNRFFRMAWKRGIGKIDVDMPKARIIKTNLVRAERDTRLATEDIELMKAEEGGNVGEATQIKAKKQALRDLPTTIQPDLEAIMTPEALEAYEPAWPA